MYIKFFYIFCENDNEGNYYVCLKYFYVIMFMSDEVYGIWWIVVNILIFDFM